MYLLPEPCTGWLPVAGSKDVSSTLASQTGTAPGFTESNCHLFCGTAEVAYDKRWDDGQNHTGVPTGPTDVSFQGFFHVTWVKLTIVYTVWRKLSPFWMIESWLVFFFLFCYFCSVGYNPRPGKNGVFSPGCFGN